LSSVQVLENNGSNTKTHIPTVTDMYVFVFELLLKFTR